MERGRENGLEQEENPTASQISHACGWLPHGTSSLAVGRMASQQLYMEAEQQPTEGIVLFKPTTLLIRGLEILGVPSPARSKDVSHRGRDTGKLSPEGQTLVW